jgi:hypothetical protein
MTSKTNSKTHFKIVKSTPSEKGIFFNVFKNNENLNNINQSSFTKPSSAKPSYLDGQSCSKKLYLTSIRKKAYFGDSPVDLNESKENQLDFCENPDGKIFHFSKGKWTANQSKNN